VKHSSEVSIVRASLFGTATSPKISIEEKENESSGGLMTEKESEEEVEELKKV